MKSFRNPKYVERYENVYFELETPLNTGNPGNNRSQEKDGHRFVADNTGEVTPFDWYKSRISVGFKVQKMDNTAIAANDANGIVNGSYSLITDIDVKLNGRKVYDCNDANHSVNIKNRLEYSPSYAQSTATNEFYYLDTSRELRPNTTSFINKPVSNFDFITWVKKLGIKHFRGIKSRDNLPNQMKKNECGIINLDTHFGPGRHWIAYRNGDKYA